MTEGVFEFTVAKNKQLLNWNVKIIIIDKIDKVFIEHEPRIIFNYFNVKKIMPGSHLKLIFNIYDYLSDLKSKIYMQVDFKHVYYSIKIYLKNRYVFAFSILDLIQLQSIRLPQKSCSAIFIIIEYMKITLDLISEPFPESSLLYYDESDGFFFLIFYINNIFEAHQT